jgi:hypothetical protein
MKTAQRWEPTALSAGRELTPARPPVAAGGFLKPGLYSPSPGRPVQTPRHWRLVSKRRGVPSRAGMVGASCRLVDVTGGRVHRLAVRLGRTGAKPAPRIASPFGPMRGATFRGLSR